ncbi:MAG: hypothetical protein ACMZ66_03870, partial [Thalassospira sp.]|uniref:hypothetical protein n=1 Tax=Thalassospira sp. TaxID=1912094 RepID=UPI003A876AF8
MEHSLFSLFMVATRSGNGGGNTGSGCALCPNMVGGLYLCAANGRRGMAISNLAGSSVITDVTPH